MQILSKTSQIHHYANDTNILIEVFKISQLRLFCVRLFHRKTMCVDRARLGDFDARISDDAAHVEIIKHRGYGEHPLRERTRTADGINFKVAESITDIGETKACYYANGREIARSRGSRLGSALRNKMQTIAFRLDARR